jgi:teichuronic acid biosynthesis glycosyltransferase TuaG
VITENSPRITVVTPAYNAAKLIGKTIDSVIKQTFTDWEMIIVDDCSTDDTVQVVEAWAKRDSRIRLECLSKNYGGPAGPRNVGIRLAKGDYIAFLDSDDIWHPAKLETQIAIADTSVDFFSCTAMSDFSCEDAIEINHISNPEVSYIDFDSQSVRAKIPTSSVLVSKSLISRFYFNEDPRYKAVEDYHCWLRILESGVLCYKIMEPMLFYRKIEGQISGSKINMMKKVFMVHINYKNRNFSQAVLLTMSHVIGALYSRFLKKGM